MIYLVVSAYVVGIAELPEVLFRHRSPSLSSTVCLSREKVYTITTPTAFMAITSLGHHFEAHQILHNTLVLISENYFCF